MEEDSGSESESEPPMSASRKRPREDDDFADPDDQPLAIAEDENAVSAKSGVIVHGWFSSSSVFACQTNFDVGSP